MMIMVPDSINSHLSEKLGIVIQNIRSVSGGSINQAYLIATNKGDMFLKFNSSVPEDFFEKEAHGLKELKKAGTKLRIPEIIAVEKPHLHRPGFILMEFIKENNNGDTFSFGAELAKLHQTRNEYFGLQIDNYIGSLYQKNGKFDNWVSFFMQRRIEPQLKLAYDSGKMSAGINAHWNSLSKELEQMLPPCQPSLLHGDLWGGNFLFDTNGAAVLIDPSVYYGHPEVDLAFSKMFGGFSADFYEGYESISPLEPGFSNRVPVYNMYPLLVHVNLFGGHYIHQFQEFIKKF